MKLWRIEASNLVEWLSNDSADDDVINRSLKRFGFCLQRLSLKNNKTQVKLSNSNQDQIHK